MKLLLLLPLCSGCVLSFPYAKETTTLTNGTVVVRKIGLPTAAGWPATQTIEKQRALASKALSLGTVNLEQETGGTNVVEALKAIDSILGKVRP